MQIRVGLEIAELIKRTKNEFHAQFLESNTARKICGASKLHTVGTKIIADLEKCFEELISEKITDFIAG